MKKDKLYLFTFLAISILFVLIGAIASKYFIALSAEQMLTTQLTSSKREVKEVAALIGNQFENKIDKQAIRENVQKTIQNSNTEISFISVLDWSGKRVCHPDITLVDTKLTEEESAGFAMNSALSSDEFYELILNPKR